MDQQPSSKKPAYGDVLWGDDEVSLEKGLLSISDDKSRKVAHDFYRDGFIKLEGAVDISLCDRAVEKYLEWCRENADKKVGKRTDGRNPRVVNLHSELDEYKQLFSRSEFLLTVLDLLFSYKASVYTSLAFEYGTEQPLHRDTPVFRTAPEKFYFGVWVALEDASVKNGCLKVLRGGHKGGVIDPYEFAEKSVADVSEIPPSGAGIWSPYQNQVVKKCQEEGFDELFVDAKKGDIIIWHPQLPHGGSKVIDPTLTRHSAVFHVVPEGTPVYQADVFFDRTKREISSDSNKKYYAYEDRLFMVTSPPNFGSN